MYETIKSVTILDCGYSNRNNITISLDEYNANTNKIYGNPEKSNLKIKSDGTSVFKLQTILNGVGIGDLVEYSFEYKNNDSNCTLYLSNSANNNQASNTIMYGMKTTKIKNSNNKWSSIKGILPCSAGATISSTYHGTAFLLGFENGFSGEIEIRNLMLKIKSTNKINNYSYSVTQKSQSIFEQKYRKDFLELNNLGNKLPSYNMVNLSDQSYFWDTTMLSLRLKKTLGNYQGNIISAQLDYPEAYSSQYKYIVVKLNYKLLSGNPKLFLVPHTNITNKVNAIDLPLTTDFVENYFIMCIDGWASKQDIINVCLGYYNATDNSGELYVKEFTVYDSIFTNLSINKKENSEMIINDYVTGTKDNGYMKLQDGTMITWTTKDVDLSTLTQTGNNLYSSINAVTNITGFSSLLPYNYTVDIVDTGLANNLFSTLIGTTNPTTCNVRIISPINTGTLKIKVTGQGRWK